ncbi:hypothetical protein KIPB_003860 [Kipferlia bialata]|uniref:Condensin II complex subunit H2 N-terminal domain-containing protein n=1 Tax=Kipferlia bialata TaxID=797122 RepID=A0A391NKV1_9EUKA|nr:hypothetical protein KIPB_003860 [Kipferlia bialata]|eukprot:g3860.t1
MDVSDDQANDRVEHILRRLEPLADLAKNWDIEISDLLSEFLETTLHYTGSFHSAASVVTRSANVYGKKVDALYATALSRVKQVAEDSR